MVEFRPVESDQAEDYWAILQHAFEIEDGPAHGDDAGDDPPDVGQDEWPPELYDPRGLFVDGGLVSVCKLYYLDAYLEDGFTTVGGLGGVATPPEHRRQGYVRRLLVEALREYRDAGVDVVTLWPFSVPFYRQFGWGIANKYTTYELPPDQLRFARGTAGTVRRLDPDDWERLRSVEVAFGSGTALSMRRSERWWRDRTLSSWSGRGEPYVYGYERGGELRGYLLYTVGRSDGGERTLRVTDLAHVDDDAYRGLLAFLADHDSQVATIRLPRAAETELLDRVHDPGEIDCTVQVGPMARLVDVADALSGDGWPDGIDARFTLAVEDSLLDRNDRRFVVQIGDGTGTVDPAPADPGADAENADHAGGNGADVDAIDVSIDVATLSRLSLGSVDVPGAERAGTCTIRDPDVREALTAAFPPREVCLREFF